MSSKTTTIQVRVDEELKQKATKVFKQMHMTMSQAIKLFLAQAVNRDGIGIEFRLPNQEIQKRMDEVDQDEELVEFSGAQEFLEELNR